MSFSPSNDQQHTPPPTRGYCYNPIQQSDAIRMLQVLPGQEDDQIRISISHHPLDDLENCEALSYEWGEGERNQDLFCEGAVIKGTPNLLAVLKVLRRRTMKVQSSETRFLWIDAICINQEDKDDKKQQLPLMEKIYQDSKRVLIYIGEELGLSREAFGIISLLDQAARGLEAVEETGFIVEDTLELGNGTQLRQLLANPAWPAVIGILSSRSYFTRLWTVQEVALANPNESQVLCGKLSCSWLAFYYAARVVQCCTALRQTIQPDSLNFINSVEHLRSMQLALNSRALGLINCVGRTEDRQCSVPHDRAFGLLGMVQKNTLLSLSHLDYEKPVEVVFLAATLVMVLESQILSHLIWRDVVLDDSKAPSWIGFSNFEIQYRFNSPLADIGFRLEDPITFEIGDERFTRGDIWEEAAPIRLRDALSTLALGVDNPILVTKGFIFDSVATSLLNFRPDNFRKQILAAYDELQSRPLKVPHSTEYLLEAIWSPLSLYNSTLEEEEQIAKRKLSFIICFSRWVLEDFGITSDILEINKGLGETGR